jgi:hypothetical protein
MCRSGPISRDALHLFGPDTPRMVWARSDHYDALKGWFAVTLLYSINTSSSLGIMHASRGQLWANHCPCRYDSPIFSDLAFRLCYHIITPDSGIIAHLRQLENGIVRVIVYDISIRGPGCEELGQCLLLSVHRAPGPVIGLVRQSGS